MLKNKTIALFNILKCGVDVLAGGGHAVASFSQYGEDMIIRAMFHRYPEKYRGFYVDIGAHHPSRFSNTCHFYKKGWRGLCVDPEANAKALFNLHRPRDQFIEAAIGAKDGEMPYYIFADPAYNTLSREIINSYAFEPLRSTIVPVYTLATLFEKNIEENNSIDFLSIDAEGWDEMILNSNNWKRYRPRLIVTEPMKTFKSNEQKLDLNKHCLLGHDYALAAKTPSADYYVDTTLSQHDGNGFLSVRN